MTIFICADHRGFELKNRLSEWLKSEGHELIDCGNNQLDPVDDYVDFAKCVVEKMSGYVISNASTALPLRPAKTRRGWHEASSTSSVRDLKTNSENHQEDFSPAKRDRNDNALGILICGSGIGVSIVANRYKGIRCALGFDIAQVKHGRENDHINCLSLPSDFVDFKKATEMIAVFFETSPRSEEKYLRRVNKIDE